MDLKYRVWSEKYRCFDNAISVSPAGYVDFGGPPYLPVIEIATGLLDSTGRMIYDGDLVDFTVEGVNHGPEAEYIKAAEVWWDPKYLCWSFGRFTGANGFEYSYTMFDRIDRNSFLIVGNKYE